jgi:hypothetical protein
MCPNHGINLAVVGRPEENHTNLKPGQAFSGPNLEPPEYEAPVLNMGPQCLPLNT